jgi:hypothetical protein
MRSGQLAAGLLVRWCDDDLLITRRPGHPKRLTDAERVCLAVAQGAAQPSLGGGVVAVCPQAPVRHVPVPAETVRLDNDSVRQDLDRPSHPALATATPTSADQLRLIDPTPVECARARPTAKRSELAGEAGYGASHSRYFWGLRLYLVATVEGMAIMWCLANPKLDEREVMQALLEIDHHQVTAGHVIPADKGFAEQTFKQFLDELYARVDQRLLDHDRRDLGTTPTSNAPRKRSLIAYDH